MSGSPQPTRTEFLLARLDEEMRRGREALDTAAHLLVLLEAVRAAILEVDDDNENDDEASWLADGVLGAFVVAWQEHPDFQPGWMSD